MFEKADEAYLEKYKTRGFLTGNDFKTEKIIYKISFIIFNICAIISLIFFFKLRKSYIVRQRGFILTFIAGIFTFINVNFGFIPQLKLVPCSLTLFSANFLNPIVNFLFLSRSLRVILYYRFNIFKVTSIGKKNLSRTFNVGMIEPNYYLPKIYKRINKIISFCVIFPTLISVIYSIVCFIVKPDLFNDCHMIKGEDALLNLKLNKGKELFYITIIYGALYTILNFVFTLLLLKVKDTNKYGIKFECISASIMILISNIINIILQRNASTGSILGNVEKHNIMPRRGTLNIFERTKGGKMLFCIVSLYMLFVSITLPVIHYYKAKYNKDKYFDDPTSSIQYFYKVLNTPSLVAELRDIAIKEFSVENVLFWENYQLLQKMVTRYKTQYKKAKEVGDYRIVSQFDYENYYEQLHQSFSSTSTSTSTSSMDESTYDPNMPVPKELLPFYTSFFNLFIDFNGPAVVNLLSDTVKHIINDLCTYPTIGMYDTAKNEVVELMFSSIYPIFLEKNKNHLIKTV